MTPTLTVGSLAYYDTFAGLVPCKVMGIYVDAASMPGTNVEVKVTATRGAYKRGETITHLHPRNVIPRGAVRVRSGQYRIRPYSTVAPGAA